MASAIWATAACARSASASPLVAVLLEPLGPLLGPFDQGGILVADLAAQFEEQVLPLGRPGRGDE